MYIYTYISLIKIRCFLNTWGFKIFREGGTLGLVIKVEYRVSYKVT